MKYMLMICDDESVILSPAEVHAPAADPGLGCGGGRPGDPYLYAIRCTASAHAKELLGWNADGDVQL